MVKSSHCTLHHSPLAPPLITRRPVCACYSTSLRAQVHRGTLKDGKEVAVKVQRAGLKELFDTDLKNLKVLVKLLDKFDPKSDGADRSYADIYEESSKLLYEEIDYLREANNGQRFANEFKKIGLDYIKVSRRPLRRVVTAGTPVTPVTAITAVTAVTSQAVEKEPRL